MHVSAQGLFSQNGPFFLDQDPPIFFLIKYFFSISNQVKQMSKLYFKQQKLLFAA
jgi:hypothetical protein